MHKGNARSAVQRLVYLQQACYPGSEPDLSGVMARQLSDLRNHVAELRTAVVAGVSVDYVDELSAKVAAVRTQHV